MNCFKKCIYYVYITNLLNITICIYAESSDLYPLQFEAAEARQGIAVDEQYAYVVGSTILGKYDKFTGELIQQWKPAGDQPLIHLDSGVIHEGKLYCSHSNYPELPMTSSVEVWDKDTLTHIKTHSFGISEGSCTWIDRYNGFWWGVFAHYNKTPGGYPSISNKWTTLVKFDDNWNTLQKWVFPNKVIERWGKCSCSGGSWGPDGFLYCTGHDRPELYKMQLPKVGSELVLIDIIPFPNEGQGIAFDRTQQGVLYGIIKQDRKVVADRILENEK